MAQLESRCHSGRSWYLKAVRTSKAPNVHNGRCLHAIECLHFSMVEITRQSMLGMSTFRQQKVDTKEVKILADADAAVPSFRASGTLQWLVENKKANPSK